MTDFTLAAAGGFAEVQVEQPMARTRVVANEMGRSMLIKDALGEED